MPPFVSVDAEAYHTVALTADGEVYAWGEANGGGQEYVPKRLPPIKKVMAASYGTVAIDTEDRMHVWSHSSETPAFTGKVRDGAHIDFSDNIAIAEDGTVYTRLAAENNGKLFYPMPEIDNPMQVVADGRNVAIIDDAGKLYIWGDYDFMDKGQPIVNVPTNLPPLKQVILDPFRCGAIALSRDGMVYQWFGSDEYAIVDPIPYFINGFAGIEPNYEPFEFPEKQVEQSVRTEDELFAAIRSGAKTIHIEDSFTLHTDIEVQLDEIHVAEGVELTIDSLNFYSDNVLRNDGTVIVTGRIMFFDEPKNAGNIVAKQRGEITYACTDGLTLETFERIIAQYPFINSISVIASDNTVIVDRDFTIPQGIELWLNAYTTLHVLDGITLTVDGTLETILEPIVDGKIEYR